MKPQLMERSEHKLLAEFTPPFWQGKDGKEMHYLYVLLSEKDNSIYVGTTDDLERRITEHNNGYGDATRRHAPFKLIYYEAYLHKADALDREHKLKHHGSVIGHLKKRLKNSLSQVT